MRKRPSKLPELQRGNLGAPDGRKLAPAESQTRRSYISIFQPLYTWAGLRPSSFNRSRHVAGEVRMIQTCQQGFNVLCDGSSLRGLQGDLGPLGEPRS